MKFSLRTLLILALIGGLALAYWGNRFNQQRLTDRRLTSFDAINIAIVESQNAGSIWNELKKMPEIQQLPPPLFQNQRGCSVSGGGSVTTDMDSVHDNYYEKDILVEWSRDWRAEDSPTEQLKYNVRLQFAEDLTGPHTVSFTYHDSTFNRHIIDHFANLLLDKFGDKEVSIVHQKIESD